MPILPCMKACGGWARLRNADLVDTGGAGRPYPGAAPVSAPCVSRDSGGTWTPLNAPRLTCTRIASLAVDRHDPRRLCSGPSVNGAFAREE